MVLAFIVLSCLHLMSFIFNRICRRIAREAAVPAVYTSRVTELQATFRPVLSTFRASGLEMDTRPDGMTGGAEGAN